MTVSPRGVKISGAIHAPKPILAAEHETTIQRLLAEALNDLFAKYGKPEIAPVDDK